MGLTTLLTLSVVIIVVTQDLPKTQYGLPLLGKELWNALDGKVLQATTL